MLSCRKETALQGALVLAKSGRLEQQCQLPQIFIFVVTKMYRKQHIINRNFAQKNANCAPLILRKQSEVEHSIPLSKLHIRRPCSRTVSIDGLSHCNAVSSFVIEVPQYSL